MLKSAIRTNLTAQLAALFLGCALTSALLSLAWNSEINNQQEHFNSLMLSVNEIVSQRISATDEQVYSLSMFFNASNYVDADEFNLFSRDFLDRHPFVQSVSYAHLVEKDIRGGFEDRLASERNAFNEKNGVGIAAPEREVYLPVKYHETSRPHSIWEPGVDLFNDSALSASIVRAFETGLMVKTPYGQGEQSASYLLLQALYADKGQVLGDNVPEKTITGLLVLRVDTQQMLKSIPSAEYLEISLSLESVTSTQAPDILATLQGQASGSGERNVLKWFHSEHKVKTPDKSMILSVRQPVFWDQLNGVVLIGAGLTGILVTLLILVFIRSILSRSQLLQQRNEQIQKIVNERTQQLSNEKEVLEASIVERERIENESMQLGKILDDSDEEIYVFDAASLLFLKVNKGARCNLGYQMDEMRELTPIDIKPDFSAAEFVSFIEPLATGEKSRLSFQTVHERKDGTTYPVEVKLQLSSMGTSAAYIAMIQDITERMQIQEKLHHMAHHDILTHLPNRTLFIERLTQGLLNARQHGRTLSVMFLDMDRFKVINDSLGHDIGDLLLQEIGRRFVECVRSCDTVARLGGDEFTILLEDISDPGDVALVADKVINTFSTPFLLSGHELFMTTSIGISMFPGDGDDVRSMLKYADTAMYRAKEQGRNNYQFYSADMSSKALERLAMENQLRRALDKNEFVIYYQPKLDYGSGQIMGAEALIRWVHPEQGLVSPAEFIPLLEETGLIVPVGEWVLKTAAAQSVAWKKAKLPNIRMSVNLSARQVEQTGLFEVVQSVVEEFDLKPGDLELELTESIIMNNAERTIGMLDSISRLGVSFSVDDFGTGYSSLAYLKRFPIQIIKIDRAFVKDITTDPDDRSIVSAIIAMSHSLDLEIIAEGVETEQQAMLLEQYGCHYMQGFLFSKPLPAAEFGELLRKNSVTLEQQAELV